MTVTDCDIVISARVGLRLQHPWSGDLVVSLEGPSGTRVRLVDRPGFPGQDFGCEFAGVDAVFADSALTAAEDTCADDQGGAVPALGGEVRPHELLATLAGQLGRGAWQLRVADFAGDDAGTLEDWSLDLVCEGLVADLALAKTADPASLFPGESVVYTLTVTNLGPGAVASAVVTDALPTGLVYLSDSCAGTAVDSAWTWRTGPLAPGAAVACELTAEVTPGAAAVVTNSAAVASERGDPAPGNDAAAVEVTVGLFADGFEDGTTGRWSATVEDEP